MKRSTRAMTNEIALALIDSAPRVGPTTSSDTILTFAAILPDLRTLARSLASSVSKLPVMLERPPVISVFTRGAEYTTSSRTIATHLPTFSLVSLAQVLPASGVMVMLTSNSLVICWKSAVASTTISPPLAASGRAG